MEFYYSKIWLKNIKLQKHLEKMYKKNNILLNVILRYFSGAPAAKKIFFTGFLFRNVLFININM